DYLVRTLQYLRVELLLPLRVSPESVDVRPRLYPFILDERPSGGRRGADNIQPLDRLPRRIDRLHAYPRPLRHLPRERSGPLRVSPPSAGLFDPFKELHMSCHHVLA